MYNILFTLLGSSFNLPRPNGFIFPSRNNGKRSGSAKQETRKGQFWNLAKPNGFFFPSVPMPQSSKRMSDEYEDVEEDTELYNLLSSIFSIPDVEEDEEILNSKRDNFDESTFFAGRGKRSDVDLDDAFFVTLPGP